MQIFRVYLYSRSCSCAPVCTHPLELLDRRHRFDELCSILSSGLVHRRPDADFSFPVAPVDRASVLTVGVVAALLSKAVLRRAEYIWYWLKKKPDRRFIANWVSEARWSRRQKGRQSGEWRVFSISDVTCTERRYNVRERVYVDDKERIEAWPNVPLTVRSFYCQTLTYLADQNGVFLVFPPLRSAYSRRLLWESGGGLEVVELNLAKLSLLYNFLVFNGKCLSFGLIFENMTLAGFRFMIWSFYEGWLKSHCDFFLELRQHWYDCSLRDMFMRIVRPRILSWKLHTDS